MGSLDELRAENRRLKALASIKSDNAMVDAERRSLKRENFRLRHSDKIDKLKTAQRRIAQAFTRTSATAAPALKAFGRGAVKAGKGVKRYGEYLNSSPQQKSSKKNKSRSAFGFSNFGGGSDMFEPSGFV